MEKRIGRPRLPWATQRLVLVSLASGKTWRETAELAGVSEPSILRIFREHGGVVFKERTPRPNALTIEEREDIFLGIRAGKSDAVISRDLGRHRGTIGREIKAGGGRADYRPFRAQDAADRRARRSRPNWTETRPWLWEEVQAKLALWWSPEQISHMLRLEHPRQPEWWVSHESIYQAIFVQTKPELRKELSECLRSGRVRRKSRSRTSIGKQGRIQNMVNISDRPAEIEDRAVPGHWEGDLVVGKQGKSAVATLVERKTRFGMIFKVESRNAAHVSQRISEGIVGLPEAVKRSLTWDQGTEMSRHATFSVATGVPVYFCDPHSPWQRGTNENWNGLLRQYLPKGTDLSTYTQQQLDQIADQLNQRPRKTLDWKTPAEQFNQLVATNP